MITWFGNRPKPFWMFLCEILSRVEFVGGAVGWEFSGILRDCEDKRVAG